MKIFVTGLRGFPNIQGGVETHCEELFPRLAALGCNITVLRRKPYVKENPPLSSYKGVKFKDLSCPSNKRTEALVHTFKSVWYAWRHNADIVHIHAIGPSVAVSLARLLKIKTVVTHHGPDYNRKKWGWFARLMIRLGERFAAMWADKIIVISTVIGDYMKQKYGRNDTRLIFNGVNIPNKENSTDYIRSLGLESGKYVLSVGRFVEEKNFDMLIKAFASLEGINGIKLVLAGDADHPSVYSEALKNMAVENNVVLTGMIKGQPLRELYSHAALFVLPSSHEGLPLTLLEAMSYDNDLLISDIPANNAIDLPADCYFHLSNDATDTATLAGALKNKLLNPVPHEYDLSAYNWDNIAAQTVAIYQELLSC